jgi:membrane-bound lytic murein transglycosylase F
VSRWLWLALAAVPLAALASVLHGVDSPRWTDRYDTYFKKYSKRYFGPNFDWRWFKAQGIAESNLDPNAESHKAARGVMQILPTTFEEIQELNPHFVDLDTPRWNIAAGIYYDRYLYRRWRERLPKHERINFTFASYNAGYGTISKAHRRAESKGLAAHRWDHVEDLAPGQTRHYVRRIHKLMTGG